MYSRFRRGGFSGEGVWCAGGVTGGRPPYVPPLPLWGSREERKAELSQGVESLSSHVVALERTTEKLRGGVDIQEAKLQELGSRVKEARSEKSQPDKEIKESSRGMVRLSSEVDGKEESLRRLDDVLLACPSNPAFKIFLSCTKR